MSLRFLSPQIKIGALMLILIGVAYQVTRIFLKTTTPLEIAGSVLAFGFIIGTALHYYRVGAAAATVNASLEGGVALLATACAMLTESRFDCGLGTRLFMYICGIAVFTIVSMVVGRIARRGLGEDEEIAERLGFLGRWSEASPFRLVSAVWGCLSAYVLTFFLLGATVGGAVVAETPVFTPIWWTLTEAADRIGGVPPIANDTAESLLRIVGTPQTGPGFCRSGAAE